MVMVMVMVGACRGTEGKLEDNAVSALVHTPGQERGMHGNGDGDCISGSDSHYMSLFGTPNQVRVKMYTLGNINFPHSNSAQL